MDDSNQGGRGALDDEPLSQTEATRIAKTHTRRAIQRLAEMMELDGRQALVARQAAKDMLQLGYPDLDDEKVNRLVEEKFKELLAEARRKLEQRTLEAVPTHGDSTE